MNDLKRRRLKCALSLVRWIVAIATQCFTYHIWCMWLIAHSCYEYISRTSNGSVAQQRQTSHLLKIIYFAFVTVSPKWKWMGRAARINQIELEHRAHSHDDARALARTLNGPFLSDEKQQIATVAIRHSPRCRLHATVVTRLFAALYRLNRYNKLLYVVKC